MNKNLTKDIEFLHIDENGNIAFARFTEHENSYRKIDNDVVFLKYMLNAKAEDDFQLNREITDELGIIHKRFQQYYKGIKVDNREYLLHVKDGKIKVMNGDYQDISIESVKPALNEHQALLKALEYLAEKSGMEKYVELCQKDWDATSQPKGELLIGKDYLKGSNSFKLSWKFTIIPPEIVGGQMIFVDAENGGIINAISLIQDVNTPGTAQTRYSGNQTITCDMLAANSYRLYERRVTTPGNSAIIHTRSRVYSFSPSTEFTNTNTNWVSGSWNVFAQSQHALDIHWGVEKVLDYWKTVHDRNSLDNAGFTVNAYAHARSSDSTIGPDTAFWISPPFNDINFGDGNGTLLSPLAFLPFTALDIVAHEMGHGITQFTANLTSNVYEESAALNEGFSDIWAACVKNWATPTKPIWRIASEIFPPGTSYNCYRDMQNPKSPNAWNRYGVRNPNTYLGQYWDFTNGAATRVHHNSTVLSHCFYLICQGGSGTNDFGISYSFAGIGFSKAERIAYQALRYLTSSANFMAARIAFIQAAINLYPATNAPEVTAVINAWDAVMVVINGPSLIYYSGTAFTFNNPPSGTITWEVTGPFTVPSTAGATTYVTKTAQSGSGILRVKVNGMVVATKAIASFQPAITGNSTIPWEGSAVYSMTPPPVSGATYSWWTGGVLGITGSSSGSSVTVNAPSPGYDDTDKVFCTVTLNGITYGNSFQTSIISIV